MTPFFTDEIVLISSPDGPITAYSATSGAAVARFTGSLSPRNGVAIVAGKSLVAASHVSSDTGAGSIRLYNWWSPAASHHLPLPEPVAPLATTREGAYLFAGGISGGVHVLRLPAGDVIQSFPAHSKPVTCFELNDDGSLLLSGSDDGTIAVISIYTLLDSRNSMQHPILHRFIGHESSVTSITTGIGGCDPTVITCSLDCSCKFWSLMHGTHLYTVSFPCPVWGVVMDAMESEYYVAGSDGSVYNGPLKVTHGRRKVHEWVTWAPRHNGPIMGLAMINGGRNLITGSEDGSVWIWELERGEVVSVIGDGGGGGGVLGGIGGVVVAKGFGDLGGNSGNLSGFGGFCGKEVGRPIRELVEMEEVLKGVVEDRSRAITNLESAIGVYEKFLELILKEAKGGGSKSDGGDEERDDE